MDEDSKELWKDLDKTANWCCKLLKEMIQSGHKFFQVYKPNGEAASLEITYCPKCGNKL